MKIRKSIRIYSKAYKEILSKNLKHKYYVNSFNTLRKQKNNFLTSTVDDGPLLQDFVTCPVGLNIQLPYPITIPFPNDCVADPCLDLLKEKDAHQQKLKTFINHYKQDEKWLTTEYVRNLKYGRIPKYMLDLSLDAFKDPDSHFTGCYNWYYSGGVLDSLLIDGQLKFICLHNRDSLCVYDAQNTKDITRIQCIDPAPIYNVKSYGNNFVSVRQKNKAYLLESIKQDFKSIFETTSDIPYIDVKYCDQDLWLIDMDSNLQLINLNTQRNSMSHKFSKEKCTSDSFAQIDFSSDGNIIFIDRDSLRILDKRSLTEKRFSPNRHCFACDDFSGMCISQTDDNYLYLSSMHNLLKIDLREMNVVKSWSHMQSSPPAIIKCRKWLGNEVIFITSQNYDGRVLLFCDDEGTHLSQLVPNIMDVYNEFNENAGFGLFDDFKDRLRFSTVGADVINNGNGIDIYCCNSVGDIFKNEISMGMVSSVKPMENFKVWINSFPRKQKPTIVTSIVEMSAMKSLFNEPIKDNNLKRYTLNNNSKLLQLFEEIDTSEIDMAAIWNSEQTDHMNNQSTLPPLMTPSRKVTEWLQTTNYDNVDEFI